MFKKFLTLVGLTTLSGVVVAGMAAGCSSGSSGPITATSDASSDAGGDSSLTHNTDASTDSGSGGNVQPAACQGDPNTGTFSNTCTAKYPGGMCTAKEIDNYYTACSPDTGSDAACKAVQLSPNCAACIGLKSTVSLADIPVLLPINDNDLMVSVDACIAVQVGQPACAVPLQNYYYCIAVACQAFDPKSTEFSNCQDQADTGACSSAYNAEAPADCDLNAVVTAEKDANNAAVTACTSPTWFQGTATALCVTGAPK